MLLTFLDGERLTFNYSCLLWTLLSKSRSALNIKQQREISISCSGTRVCLAISPLDGHSVLQINLRFLSKKKILLEAIGLRNEIKINLGHVKIIFSPHSFVWNKNKWRGVHWVRQKMLFGQIKADKIFRSNKNQKQVEAAEMNEHPQTAHLSIWIYERLRFELCASRS